MRVLIDLAVEPVAPVLQELRGRARVVDLVEVHLVRLGQAEHPDPERRRDEHGQDPEVEPIEAAGRLIVQRPRPVRADGPLGELRPEPLDGAELGEARRVGPGRDCHGCRRQ